MNVDDKLIYEAYLQENTNAFLSTWAAQDQKERNEYKRFVHDQANNDYSQGAELWRKIKNRSSDDVFNDRERLEKFINTTFNFDEFRQEDWRNYWLLAQHSDRYVEFQKKALDTIEKYLGTENDLYRFLYDRVSMNTSGTQKYNTQQR